MARQGSLFEVHRAGGATFREVAGWEVPDHFGDPAAEYEAARKAVGLFDLSHQGKVRLTGGDCGDFLHRLLSADVKALRPGQGCRAFLLNPKGHVVAYLALYALEEGYLAEAEPGMASAMMETLDRYIIADEVTLEDASEGSALLSLQGPAAPAVLAEVLGGGPSPLEPLSHLERDVAGGAVRLVANSRTGEAGYDLWVPAERAAALWEVVAGAGARHGLRPVGARALDVLRLEAGLAWAADLGGDVLAMETGLEHAISFTKGCYVGQEFVIRIAHRGHVNRRLAGLLLKGDRVPAAGDKVLADDREAGWVTSAAFSPALGRPIALGYVRREHLEPGSRVTVRAAGGPLDAEVVALPFLKGVRTFKGSKVRLS